MISKDMSDHLSRQVTAELYSELLYNSMAAWAMNQDLPGLYRWLRFQAEEEHLHAMKILAFVLERGGEVTFTGIDAPPSSWENVRDLLEALAAHEKIVTGLIHGLVDLAYQQRDHGTSQFLQWFIAEQVEEEATAEGLLGKCRMLESVPGGNYMFDQELGARTFSPTLAEYLPNGINFGKY